MWQKIVGALCLLHTLHYSCTWTIVAKPDNISPSRPDIYRFCPTTAGCEDGLHVLCLLNKNIYGRHGPSCNYTAEVTLLDVHKYKIVNYINSIRRKAALGKEKAEPRGYGINIVAWDPYLADFAQIWADQCIIRADRACHATPDFPNPAQLVTSIRYSFPPLKKLQRRTMDKTKNRPKLKPSDPQTRAKRFVDRTLQMVIEAWYNTKTSNARNMYYDQVVYHRVTHIGCGISVFVAFEHQTRKENDPVLNHMMLVCNLSHKLPINEKPYNTVKNTSAGFTTRCGCPPGTSEDEDTCLCYQSSRQEYAKDCPFGFCKPKVVLLPIVTVENAPSTRKEQGSMANFGGNEKYFNVINGPSHIVSLHDKEGPLPHQASNTLQDLTRKLFNVSKLIDKNRYNMHQDGNITEPQSQHRFLNTFGNQKNITITNPQMTLDLLVNVGKDNERLQKTKIEEKLHNLHDVPISLLKDNRKSNTNGNIDYFSRYPIIGSGHRNKVKLKVNFGVNNNSYNSDRNSYGNANSKPLITTLTNTTLIDDYREHDLLRLLNKLENEVHHLQLSTAEKDLLHNKLSKIYNDIGSNLGNKGKAQDEDRANHEKDNKKQSVFYRTRPIVNPREHKARLIFRKANERTESQDVLSINRRRYYQEKLEKLAQKLLKRRRQHNHDNARYVRPTLQDNYAQPYPVYPSPIRPFGDMIYVPSRARSVHGYNFF